MPAADRCPCGQPRSYEACCGRLHGGVAATTAEELMRSRYSAFVVGDAGYLLRTWSTATRPSRVPLDPEQRWTRLEVLSAAGGMLDDDGVVAFRAHHERDGRAGVLHERSRFVREGGAWVYAGPLPD